MPRTSKGPSTLAEVDSFANFNLYQILQIESVWLCDKSASLHDQQLLALYSQWFWSGFKIWTRKFGARTRREQVRRFCSALRNWLGGRELLRYRFCHLEEMKYLDDRSRQTLKLRPHACKPECTWSLCPNVLDLRECDERCRSLRKCDNQFSAVPFDWQSLMEVRYVNEQTGLGLFAKTALSKDAFIGEFLGESVTRSEFSVRKKDPLRHSYMMHVGGRGHYGIDPTFYGNHTRFMNHSCRPNCIALTWLSRGQWKISFTLFEMFRR